MPNHRLRLAGLGNESLLITGPSSGLERAVSPGAFIVTVSSPVPFGTTVKITPSDGAGGRFFSLDSDDASGANGTNGGAPNYVRLRNVTVTNKQEAAFVYVPASPGAKTITFTNDSGYTNPASMAYTASAATPGSATPFRLTRGGSTVGSFATLQQCKDVPWASGDVVKVASGTYAVYGAGAPGTLLGSGSSVDIATVTIEAEDLGNRPTLDCSWSGIESQCDGDENKLLIMGNAARNLTLRGINLRGARGTKISAAMWTAITSTPPGSGLGLPACTMTLEYCKFINFTDAVKTQGRHFTLSTYVRYCVFEDCSGGAGLEHDIYTGLSALTEVVGCSFYRTRVNQGFKQSLLGHCIKSRSRATTVKACLIDAYKTADHYGGCTTGINIPNGGIVNIVGNTILHYGAESVATQGNPIRMGEDQHTATADTSVDPGLTAHTFLIAQNTIRHAFGRTGDANYPRAILSAFPGGVTFGNLLDGAGANVAVTCTVQNNIVAHDVPSKLADFTAAYPNNSAVSLATISDVGLYSGSAIAGSPATNNADLEWAGDYTIPTARADTNRGGRTPYIPSWVPTTAWQWTDVPGTNWNLQVKSDGTGSSGGPSVSADPGGSPYGAIWGPFNGPCYSQARHEIYMFGGGHAQMTNNILTRYELGGESPSVTMACAPTPGATISAEFYGGSGVYPTADLHFTADGKPYSPHSYRNNFYLDDQDLFVCVPLHAAATASVPGVSGSGISGVTTGPGGAGGGTVATWSRATGEWLSSTYFDNFPSGSSSLPSAPSGPRFAALDGSCIYYYRADRGLCKLDTATRTHSTIGGSGTPFSEAAQYYSRQADDGTGRALVLGATSTTTWQARTLNLSSGVVSAELTVSGDSLPSALTIVDLVYVPSRDYFVSVWVNHAAWGSQSVAISTLVVATLTITSPTTATASIKTMTGTPPVRCGAYKGVFYDPTYDCLLYACNYDELVKAIKVN